MKSYEHFRALGEYFFVGTHTHSFSYRPQFFYYRDRRHTIHTMDQVYEAPQSMLGSWHFNETEAYLYTMNKRT